MPLLWVFTVRGGGPRQQPSDVDAPHAKSGMGKWAAPLSGMGDRA